MSVRFLFYPFTFFSKSLNFFSSFPSFFFLSIVQKQGLIDEFRVWGFEKSDLDIRNQMSFVLQGNEPNLLLYYNFDEDPTTTDGNSPSKVRDLTGRGNDLIFGGCTQCQNQSSCDPTATPQTPCFYVKKNNNIILPLFQNQKI